MNEQELNKKLAEWVGLKCFRYKDADGISQHGDYYWNEYGEVVEGFTQSLDTCFKWLVPLAIKKLEVDFECGEYMARSALCVRWLEEGFDALALCLAIEKLIDGGE